MRKRWDEMDSARRVSLVVYIVVAVTLLSGGLWALLTDQRGAALWSIVMAFWVFLYLVVDNRLKRASERRASEREL